MRVKCLAMGFVSLIFLSTEIIASNSSCGNPENWSYHWGYNYFTCGNLSCSIDSSNSNPYIEDFGNTVKCNDWSNSGISQSNCAAIYSHLGQYYKNLTSSCTQAKQWSGANASFQCGNQVSELQCAGGVKTDIEIYSTLNDHANSNMMCYSVGVSVTSGPTCAALSSGIQNLIK